MNAAPGRLSCLLLLAAAASHPIAAQTGLVPLVDLGAGLYEGYPGGLYPGGSNVPPPAHLAAALQAAASIEPLDATGLPDADGLIVLIAIGMSNTAHEFGAFEGDEDASAVRNARVVLMDTALGGQSAAVIANPAASYWSFVTQRLTAMGLTSAQVQVAWVKQADASPPDDFPLHAQTLRAELETIANNLHDKFPNLKLCYLSSRTYGGYAAPGTLNPEPQAYESGFSVKWLIEDQIAGDPGLNHDLLAGPVRSPLLLWGPYLWADGTNPRSDGLTWLLTDFENDRTHPSPAGEQKVAGLLSAFFAADVTAAPWWPARPDATLVAIDVRDDAHVRAASPGTNFGSELQLLAQGGASPTSIYVSFDAADAAGPARLAKLGLRVAQGGGGRVSLVGDSTWSEDLITYATAPAIGSPLVDMPPSSRDGTIAADVTAAVNADPDGILSFALTLPNASEATYHSREGAAASGAHAPPRLVLVLPTACAGSPDTDGDGRPDACDCSPDDPSAFAVPGEVSGLRWLERHVLSWTSVVPVSGDGARYDVMSGDLVDVGQLGPGPSDRCLVDDTTANEIDDPSSDPLADTGLFLLVLAENVCGKGRWETATDGRDRSTTVCP